MFWAINQNTKELVSSINVHYGDLFLRSEKWFAPSFFIEEVPEGYNIDEIPVKFRLGNPEVYRENLQQPYGIPSHFYIDLPKEISDKIKLVKNNKYHEKTCNFLSKLLLNNKLKLIVNKNSQNIEIERDMIDFYKLDYEVVHTSKRTIRSDITLPFKKYHEFFGLGIIIELQLTKQSKNIIWNRTEDRASMGYSVSWVFEDEYNNGFIEVLPFIHLIKEIKERTIENIRIYCNDMVTSINKLIDSIPQQNIFCPLCNNLMILREGKYGQFYACSNYPFCRKTIPIIKKKEMVD